MKRSNTLDNGSIAVERYTSPTKTLSGLLDLEVANGQLKYITCGVVCIKHVKNKKVSKKLIVRP